MRKCWILLVVLGASCAPIYVPSTRNVPLFRGQGETQLSGYFTSGGAEGQLAYALTNGIAVSGSYAYGTQKRTNPDFTRKNSIGEVALGFYGAGNKSRFDIYFGYGVGQGTNLAQYYFFADELGQGDTIVTAKMNKFFVQPSIGTNNKNFNIAFTPRFSMVNLTEFSVGDLVKKPDEKPHLFIEPALTGKFRIGGNLFGVFQLGLAQGLPNDAFFKYQPLQVAFGLQIDTGAELATKVYKKRR